MNKTTWAVLFAIGLAVIWARSENRKEAYAQEKAASVKQAKLAAGIEGVEKTDKDFALSCPSAKEDGSRMIVLHSEEAGKMATAKLNTGKAIWAFMAFNDGKNEDEICIRSDHLWERTGGGYALSDGTVFGKGTQAFCDPDGYMKSSFVLDRTTLQVKHHIEAGGVTQRIRNLGTCQIIDFKAGTQALSQTISNASRIIQSAKDKAAAEKELRLRSHKI